MAEIVEAVVQACGLPLDDPRVRTGVADTVKHALRAKAAVLTDDGGKPKRWSVVR